MTDDIVTRLRNIALLRGNLSGSVIPIACTEAADEIERLREQLEFAHNILGSETMIWVFHGSENWQQSNIDHLRDPIHAYWEKYGNFFQEASNDGIIKQKQSDADITIDDIKRTLGKL